MAINFWCAECGAPLAAADTDAGREVECIRCGAVVTAPRNPPPLPAADDEPAAEPAGDEPRPVAVFAAADARPALSGLALLLASLTLAVVGLVAAAGVVAARVYADGVALVLQGDPGTSGRLVAAAAGFDILLALVGGGLRVVGYVKCRPVGRLIGADAAVLVAAIGAAVATAGWAAGNVAELFAAGPNRYDPALLNVELVGQVVFLLGAVAEFAALVFFRRLLDETFGASAADRVRRYLMTFLVAAGAVVSSCAGLAFVMLIAPMPRPAPPNPAAGTPVFLTAAAATFATVTAAAAAILYWQYYRLLTRCRAALAAAIRAVSAAEAWCSRPADGLHGGGGDPRHPTNTPPVNPG